MKTILSSIPNLISAASFIKKLHLLVAALLLFFCNDLSAGIKPVNWDKGSHITKHGINAAIKIKGSTEIASPTVSYSGPQTYTAGTAITTLLPGGSGVAAIGNVGALVGVGSGFNPPEGMFIDAAGNIYVADAGNNAVKKMPAGGGVPISIGSGFSSPSAVAVDVSGNMYVTDAGNNAVKKIPLTGGVYGAPVALGSGFSNPSLYYAADRKSKHKTGFIILKF